MTHRQITTEAQLKELGRAAIIRDSGGDAWEFDKPYGHFLGMGMSGSFPPGYVELPALVIWEPNQ